jgi:hypothetical protein
MLKHAVHERPEFHELEPVGNEKSLRLRLKYDSDKIVPNHLPVANTVAKIIKAKKYYSLL